MESTEWL